MRVDGTRWAGAAIVVVAVGVIVAGAWRIARLIAEIASGAPVELGSGWVAIPLLGLSLGALGVLVGLPEMGGRHPRQARALFAGFLLFGLGAIAAAIAGPGLTAWVMNGVGYRGCERRVGVRTEQVRWVAAGVRCDAAVYFRR